MFHSTLQRNTCPSSCLLIQDDNVPRATCFHGRGGFVKVQPLLSNMEQLRCAIWLTKAMAGPAFVFSFFSWQSHFLTFTSTNVESNISPPKASCLWLHLRVWFLENMTDIMYLFVLMQVYGLPVFKWMFGLKLPISFFKKSRRKK